MKKAFMIIFGIIISIPLFAMMGDEPERTTVEMPKAALKLIPNEMEILMSVKADLNGDDKDDFLVAAEEGSAEESEEAQSEEEGNEGLRRLLIITASGNGYKLAEESSRTILCRRCGGIYGDPFVRIWADKKSFGVNHFGGSNFKWSNNSEFGYSGRDKTWQLVAFDSYNYDLENDVEEDHLTPDDFGLINLRDFDINYYMSEGKIEPVPDETQAAIYAQQTADVEASYTPTPVPTYVYKTIDKLKNREMQRMTAGTFIQSDGNTSFAHTLSGYSIGKIPVTYELWYVVRIWAEKNGYKFQLPGLAHDYGQNELPDVDSSAPVLGATRRDAIVWCNAYSRMAKLKPVYYSDKAFKKPLKSSVFGDYASTENKNKGGFDDPYVNWNASGYRLPTEAEWLYAIAYIDGKNWAHPDAKCNTMNSLGLLYYPEYLSEMLWDKYAPYPNSPQKDYRGPDIIGGPNVMHSGVVELSPVNPNTRVVGIGERISQYPLVGSLRNTFRVVSGNK